MNKTLLCAALAGVLTVGFAAGAHAADGAAKVKCFGIAKAGKNSCKALDASHSCAGQAKTDNSPVDFALVSSNEECTKDGGKLAN